MESVADTVSGVAKGRNFRGRKTVVLPYLRVANVQAGYLDLELVKEIEALEDEAEMYRLQKGDLLLTEGGDWDKLGRSAIWKGQIENCIHQNHIYRARPFSTELSTIWLMLCTNSAAPSGCGSPF
jgi:type I restriction enzyme S subunit